MRRTKETNPSYEILIQHIKKLGGELNSGGAATANHKAEKVLALLIGSSRKASTLKVFDDLFADFPSVRHVFEIIDMLKARNSMCACFRAFSAISIISIKFQLG